MSLMSSAASTRPVSPNDERSADLDGRTNRSTWSVVAAIALMGGVVTALSWRSADNRTERDERATARLVVDRLDTEMRVIDAALTGAPVLAWPTGDPYGPDTRAAFERFASELVEHTSLRAVAYEPLVAGDDRARFEVETGVAIRDPGDGDWTEAPARPAYAPVLWVVPRSADTTAIIGFDIAAEPLRGQAVRRAATSDEVELTQPLVSRPQGTTSVFAVRALVVDGRTLGWVSSAISAAVFESALDQVIDADTRVTVADAGVLLFGDGRPSGTYLRVPIGTRSWDVWVNSPPSRHVGALTSAVLAALMAVGAGVVLGHRRASRIDRERAAREERALVERRADRAAALSQLGQQLSVARDIDDIVGAVILHGPPASGFEVVGLATLHDGDRIVRLHGQRTAQISPTTDAGHADGAAAAARRHGFDVDVPDRAPVLDLLRRGDELSLDDPETIDRTGLLRSIVGDDVAALDLVPLRNSSLRLIGAVGFASSSRPPLPEPGYLRSIADLVAQTIERTQLFEQQAQVVLELQQHTLRPIPDIVGARLAARYLPAARAIGVGGDWYDVEEVSDHETVLVVGDVVGHGITAVVDMVEISGLIAAMARTGELSSLPSAAASLFERPRQPLTRMATAIVCRVDTAARVVEYVRLGHPPAVLVGPDGTACLLEQATHPPIGVAAPDGRSAKIEYAPGSVLVLYTDGLIERRGERIDVGLQRLVDASTGLVGCAPDEIADALVERCAHDHTTDDIALLVARLD